MNAEEMLFMNGYRTNCISCFFARNVVITNEQQQKTLRIYISIYASLLLGCRDFDACVLKRELKIISTFALTLCSQLVVVNSVCVPVRANQCHFREIIS